MATQTAKKTTTKTKTGTKSAGKSASKSAAKKTLVIVESPSKAKTIGKYLGSSYKVIASVGHVRDLPKSKLGIDVEHDFEPQYIPIRGKGDLIKELKKEAKAAGKVYLATDPDREGGIQTSHPGSYLIKSRRTRSKRLSKHHAPSISVWWTRSRPDVRWIAWWAIRSVRFFGARYAEA